MVNCGAVGLPSKIGSFIQNCPFNCRIWIKEKLAEASAFLQGLIFTAEQLTNSQRWERILLRIFERFIQPKIENTGLPALATG
jgi:hypothetical protein